MVEQQDTQGGGPERWKLLTEGGSPTQEQLRDGLRGWCCCREMQSLHTGKGTCCHEPMCSQEELRGDLHLHLAVREPEDGEVLGLASPVGHPLLLPIVRCGAESRAVARLQQPQSHCSCRAPYHMRTYGERHVLPHPMAGLLQSTQNVPCITALGAAPRGRSRVLKHASLSGTSPGLPWLDASPIVGKELGNHPRALHAQHTCPWVRPCPATGC